MKPVEIMALLVAAAVIVKLVVALINPGSWLKNITTRFFSHPILTILLSTVLAVVALVFLLKELTIVQIFASLLFLMPLIALAFVPFAGDLLDMVSRILSGRNALKKAWLASLIWLILALWVLYALFV